MPEMNAEHLKLQNELFEAIGVTPDDRQIVSDLAKHAAQQAVKSIDTIAKTVHDPRMMNVVLLSAMMLVGEAAEKTIADRMAAAIQRMPPELRDKFAQVMEVEGEQPVQTKPTGVRDFDGNYR
jgi:DNA-binding protein YbaB